MLIRTKPNSSGKEAAIFRSRQLTEFQWTPLKDIPIYIKSVGKTRLIAGEAQTGMLYSSTEPTDKFVTENISFETFLSIIANPDSALYTKDLSGHNNSWAYFGLVCNGLVRYALNILPRYSTKRWPSIPGMRKIADEASYTVEQIELCDVLYAFGKGRNHVAFITDILRDAAGTICKIEVSEAIRPTCVRVQYDVETFYEKYKLFALWRYDFVDDVPYPDAYQAQVLQDGVPNDVKIAVDYGNKTNYRAYEDVVISLFGEEEHEIEICCEGDVLERVCITGTGNITRKFARGYYTVKHLNSGEVVEFCVTEPKISHMVADGKITVKVDACDPESRILHMDFRERAKEGVQKTAGKDDENTTVLYYSSDCAALSKVELLSEEEQKTGVIIREIPEDAANFKINFENKYGIWTHTMIKI